MNSNKKVTKQIVNDNFMSQLVKELPEINQITKFYWPSNQDITFVHLHQGDTFGESKGKLLYSVIAERDSVILELQYEEKYWRAFEIRHSFLERLNISSDLQLLSVCLKEKAYKYGEYIYKEGQQRKWIYMVVDGEVEFLSKNQIIYVLGKQQIFGFEEFLKDSRRVFTTRCKSAELKCFVVSNLQFLNLSHLETLARSRNLMIQQILRQKKDVFRISQSVGIEDVVSNKKEDYNNFVSVHWQKNLTQLPRWNLEQLTKDFGGYPGQGIVKSNQYRTPQIEQSLIINSQRRAYSILEVNPEQYNKLVKSYAKRMRAEKYSELHACLKGKWENISRVSSIQPSSEQKKRATQEYMRKQKELKQNFTELNQTFRDQITQSPMRIRSEFRQTSVRFQQDVSSFQ